MSVSLNYFYDSVQLGFERVAARMPQSICLRQNKAKFVEVGERALDYVTLEVSWKIQYVF